MDKEYRLFLKELRHLHEEYRRCNIQMIRVLIREDMLLIMKALREINTEKSKSEPEPEK
ncbi:hypothetical protein [Bacillus sp. UMB0893]|uniref:hypothetical protein n=1 Tax=Bacillus sp. UMB0893 TaxID=2066053 RepID=UPI001586E852|nr:hypothetical protein [Bacillus sp. UMB0893]